MRLAILLGQVFATACLAAPGAALAQDADGTYGRIRGDLALSVEALGAAAAAADTGTWNPGLSVAVRARALDMVGAVAGYDHAFAASRFDFVHASVDFRPAFFARWSYDLERGPRWLDLFLDSIGLELGAAYLRPGASDANGFGFVVGTGADIPLHVGERNLWSLRLAFRWVSAHPFDAQGTGRDDTSYALLAGVVFRTMVRAGLVPSR